MPNDAKRAQVVECLLGAAGGYGVSLLQTSQHLGDLDVQQVRGVEHLRWCQEQTRELLESLAAEQQVDRCRRVDNDQRVALDTPRASAELSPPSTRERRSRRSRISRGEGRRAASSSSASR